MSRNCIFSRRRTKAPLSADARFPVPISAADLKQIFSDCCDFELRPVWPGGNAVQNISVCWLDGVVSGKDVSQDVLRPLTDFLRMGTLRDSRGILLWVLRGGVYACAARERRCTDDVVADLTSGCCAVVFDDVAAAVTFEVKSSNTRAISEPSVEKTVKGAKDAFVETLRVNTALVRRRLRNPDLKITQLSVGRRSATQVALLYLESVADDRIVRELRRRLDAIDIDGLTTAGSIEQYIVDAPHSPLPQLLHTERPDKFAAELLSGRVGILADGLPLGFLAPAALSRFLQVAEDRSQHFLTASLLLMLRWLSLVLTVLLPALLVAISMYHQEMIPFPLMTSMIDAKQQVPFSSAVEVLGMLVAFELLQEAGVRLPNPVGDTVSIIGALIVGQAAVDARVVSPVAVIVVATAGICGFTQPSQDLGAALRIARFLAVFAAIALGMYGIMLSLALMVWHLCTIDSFGASYTAPLSEADFLSRLRAFLCLPLPRDKYRPAEVRPKDARNQK